MDKTTFGKTIKTNEVIIHNQTLLHLNKWVHIHDTSCEKNEHAYKLL